MSQHLHLHRAERADRLVEALAEVLAEPLADPFTTEVVCVPTRGVERWLAQRLSHRLGTSTGGQDGICSGVWFPSLRQLISAATEPTRTGHNPLGAQDPWQPDRAVWPLLRVIDESRNESWAALLWSYLAGSSRGPEHGADPEQRDAPSAIADRPAIGSRRWRTSRQLAELFTRYASSRPAMIDHWAAGRDVDAQGDPLPTDLAWQAELWRRLRERLGTPSPPDQLRAAIARLGDEPSTSVLPARLSVFGVTRLGLDHQQVLTALAEHREVHLWLPHPSPALWAAVAADPTRRPGSAGRRVDDPTTTLERHPLLGYLGRDSRELQLGLDATGAITSDRHHPAEVVRRDTVLNRLQTDLAANAEPSPSTPLDPNDRSVQIHATYGPDRQVEVLREVLVGLLADDPTLEPRDIVVMCPDIERFAPLVSAAFGLDTADDRAEHPGHRLRVRLADRSLRQLNPLLSVLSQVLDLADSRMTASSLLDLAAYPPVARKFGFTEDDTSRLASLVTQAGVRWGLDAPHRRPYGLEGFGQNTWAAGLDRMLLGVAMDADGDHFIGTALPLDDVDSSDVDLVGRLTELVVRIRRFVDVAAERRSLSEWAGYGRTVIDGLTATSPADSWQVNHAYAQLSRLTDAAGDTARDAVGDIDETLLGLAEVRALLADSFRGRASRANFRTGTLTIATLHPMRSIPHRVVCLLGVDDGLFPRRSRPFGDDLLALDEWVGDPDPRSEDRQLLLDAIMAAEDHLVIIYGGADPRSGAERPPAVPIGELLDALDRTVSAPDDRLVREHLTTRHPLQPFEAGNFAPRADGRPFSFDPTALRGALAAGQPQQPAPAAFGTGPLRPADIGDVIALPDLVRFFGHPARTLLRVRANLTVFSGDDGTSADQLAVSLDGLERWEIGERLLQRHLQGGDLDQLAAAEWRRGSLPPRSFGDAALSDVLSAVREVADRCGPYRVGDPSGYDVAVEVGGSRLVAGTVQPAYETALLRVGYGRLTARQRLSSWLELLALSAGRPDRRWRAITVGRGGTSVLGPLDPDWAQRVLADLVELYLTGLQEPLPFVPKTSAEYAQVRYRDRSVDLYRPVIEKAWKQERDPIWERFLGGNADLAELMEQPTRTWEERGTLVEPTRFGTLARRVFSPMFDHEELS